MGRKPASLPRHFAPPLVEASWFEHRDEASPERIAFCLSELRTAELLVEVVERFAAAARALEAERPLLRHARQRDVDSLETVLAEEVRREQEADRAYWRPLRAELERLRRERRATCAW